jgi:phage-related protein
MANQSVGSIRGTIKIDYDGKGIVEAIRDTDDAKGSMGKLDKAANLILGTFGKFAKGAFKVGAAALTISGGLHTVAGILATIGPLIGAGLATLPAVLATVASAVIVGKIAVMGMGKALQAASGDAKEFDKAIAGLPKNAQAFAKAYRESLPALKSVQSAIQNAFFKGLAPQLTATVKTFTGFKRGASGVATAMNMVVKQVLQFARSPIFIKAVEVAMDNVRTILRGIAPLIGPLLKSFAGLAAQGNTIGANLVGPLRNGLTTITKFVNGVDLAKVFAKAGPIISAISTTFSTIGGIIGPIFSTLTNGGQNAAGILGTMAKQLADFLASAQGKEALDALGKAFEAISTGAGQVFLALLQAAGPILIALAPGITALATQISAALVPAIQTVAPILQDVAKWLSENVSWLGPFALGVGVVAVAIKGYIAVQTVWNNAQKLATKLKLKDAAAWTLLKLQLLLTRAQLVAFTLYQKGAAAGAWVLSTAKILANRAAVLAVWLAQKAQLIPGLIASTAAVVKNTAVTALNAAMRAGAFLASWVVTTGAMIAQKIAMLATIVVMNAIKVATLAWTAVQWLLNAALDANPIGIIIILIAALIVGIIMLWKHSETFRKIVMAVWNGIKFVVMAVVNWIKDTAVPWLKAAWKAISDAATFMWNLARAAFNTGLAVVKKVIAFIVNIIKTDIAVIMAVWDRIKQIPTILHNAFTLAYNKVKSIASTIVAYVKGLPGKLISALGNLGSLLYNKGKDLLQGFLDGIKSVIGKIEDTIKGVVGKITDFLPGSPAKKGPLSGHGYVLLRGQRFITDFAKGMDNAGKRPVRAVRSIVSPVAQAVPSTASATVSGASTRAAASTSHGPYAFILDGKVFAKFVIDTVTGEPQVISDTNSEGSRLVAWAGSGRNGS